MEISDGRRGILDAYLWRRESLQTGLIIHRWKVVCYLWGNPVHRIAAWLTPRWDFSRGFPITIYNFPRGTLINPLKRFLPGCMPRVQVFTLPDSRTSSNAVGISVWRTRPPVKLASQFNDEIILQQIPELRLQINIKLPILYTDKFPNGNLFNL